MDTATVEPSMYTVKAIMILDNDGDRILAKYYDDTWPSTKEQKEFEKNLFQKTHRANAEIVMFEGVTCVYRSNVDLFFYVIGSSFENELLLVSVLSAFYDSVSQMLRKNVEKSALFDNLDGAMLILDEIVDRGIILESDSTTVSQRVAMKMDDVPLSEQSVTQVGKHVLQTARDQLKWSLLK
ncbi:coatomer subunit zeta-1-like [Corticium candelabrum]|uniref:coatomer subunit zeta-1-like n=1 Tax=Corticium candelabrum TaxID=121492 RepID=UPI002E2593AF|nr:coatomer subunit zeta-1-like [Corticium candelabrum]